MNVAQGEFSVCTFFEGDFYEYELRSVDAETAVNKLKFISQSVGARVLGIVERIIVTDGGDNICVEWKKGEGIVFPPKET